jgi:hypothetical protein
MKVNFHSTGALDKSLATKLCTNPTNTIPDALITRLRRHAMLDQVMHHLSLFLGQY